MSHIMKRVLLLKSIHKALQLLALNHLRRAATGGCCYWKCLPRALKVIHHVLYNILQGLWSLLRIPPLGKG